MSQQEDDLRALAKNYGFSACRKYYIGSCSSLLVLLRSHQTMGTEHRCGGQDTDEFHRTAGLFGNMLYTKLFALVLMGLSCLGTKGVKEEHITWAKIWTFMGIGFVFFFLIGGYSPCHCP